MSDNLGFVWHYYILYQKDSYEEIQWIIFIEYRIKVYNHSV